MVKVSIKRVNENLKAFLRLSLTLDRKRKVETSQFNSFEVFQSEKGAPDDWSFSMAWGHGYGQINLSLRLNGKDCFSECNISPTNLGVNTLALVMFFTDDFRSPTQDNEEEDLVFIAHIVISCLEEFWFSDEVARFLGKNFFGRLGLPTTVEDLKLIKDIPGSQSSSLQKRRRISTYCDLTKQPAIWKALFEDVGFRCVVSGEVYYDLKRPVV